MLKIKNTEVFGLYRSLKASGNPMTTGDITEILVNSKATFERGQKLGKAKQGSGHDNFLKGIIVQFDVKYPQYWTPEAQRYHWLEIVSSQSKMHRLTAAASSGEFGKMFNKYVDKEAIERVQEYVRNYNEQLELDQDNRLLVKDNPDKQYFWFMKALSNLPMGYEMWESLTTNYLQLKTIYHQRKNHKLKEDWGPFCEWVEELPHFKELILD